MNEARRKETEALKDKYREFLREAESANECGNVEGMISVQRKMAANVSRQIVLDMEGS